MKTIRQTESLFRTMLENDVHDKVFECLIKMFLTFLKTCHVNAEKSSLMLKNKPNQRLPGLKGVIVLQRHVKPSEAIVSPSEYTSVRIAVSERITVHTADSHGLQFRTSVQDKTRPAQTPFLRSTAH